jgi:hypothetical protein
MSRGVNLCHVAQLDYCIALGAVRSGASSGVRPGLAVQTTSRFLLGALQGFRWISSRIPCGRLTSALSIRVCSQAATSHRTNACP